MKTGAAPNFLVIEKDPVFYCYTVTMGLSENRQVSHLWFCSSGKLEVTFLAETYSCCPLWDLLYLLAADVLKSIEGIILSWLTLT